MIPNTNVSKLSLSDNEVHILFSNTSIMNFSLIQNTYYCNTKCSATLHIRNIDINKLPPLSAMFILPYMTKDFFYFNFTLINNLSLGLKNIKYLIGLPTIETGIESNGTIWQKITWNYTNITFPNDFIFRTGNFRLRIEGEKYKDINNNIDWKPTFFGVIINEWANWSSAPGGKTGRNISLSSPLNNTNLTSLTNTFVCNATNPGAAITNISLWHNSTGIWVLNQTISYINNTDINVTNKTSYKHDHGFNTIDSNSGTKGILINIRGFDVYLYGFDKSTSSGATGGQIRDSVGAVIQSCTFIGVECRFETIQKLNNNTNYSVTTTAGSAVNRHREDNGASITYPLNSDYIVWSGGVVDVSPLSVTFSDWHEIRNVTLSNTRPNTNVSASYSISTPTSGIWNCNVFDEDNDEGWALSNSTWNYEIIKPNLTI